MVNDREALARLVAAIRYADNDRAALDAILAAGWVSPDGVRAKEAEAWEAGWYAHPNARMIDNTAPASPYAEALAPTAEPDNGWLRQEFDRASERRKQLRDAFVSGYAEGQADMAAGIETDNPDIPPTYRDPAPTAEPEPKPCGWCGSIEHPDSGVVSDCPTSPLHSGAGL